MHEARRFGFLGPGPLSVHCGHSAGFLRVLVGAGRPYLSLEWLSGGRRIVDLGSGSGVPGLVIAWFLENVEVILIDSNARRAEFLVRAAEFLGLESATRVVCERAELVGHDPAFREGADLVVARSFGPPAVTAECGSALTRVGGYLAVSDAPQPSNFPNESRWPNDSLGKLGLTHAGTKKTDGRFSYAVLEKVAPLPDQFPRRVGIPAKRPLW